MTAGSVENNQYLLQKFKLEVTKKNLNGGSRHSKKISGDIYIYTYIFVQFQGRKA